MALSVIRSRRSLVTPSQQTQSGKLDLSLIDKVPVLRCYTRTLHVYKYGPEASKVIREALSKALVPYYPLAGRLKDSGENQLQVECSGEGMWFVEASADCTLDAFNYFDNVNLSTPYDELLPDQVPKSEGMEPLVQMQVLINYVNQKLNSTNNTNNVMKTKKCFVGTHGFISGDTICMWWFCHRPNILPHHM